MLQWQGSYDFNGEIGCFIGSIAGSQCGKHIAFGGDSKTGPASLDGFFLDIQPQFAFPGLDLFIFRVIINFAMILSIFSSSRSMMSSMIRCALWTWSMKSSESKLASGGKGFINIIVQVDGQQPAAVVGASGISPQGLVETVLKPRSA